MPEDILRYETLLFQKFLKIHAQQTARYRPALAENNHVTARKLNRLYCVYTDVDRIVEERYSSTSRFLSFREKDMKTDRKSTRLNSSHLVISYAVFCLKKK